jgi:hypothetical protein
MSSTMTASTVGLSTFTDLLRMYASGVWGVKSRGNCAYILNGWPLVLHCGLFIFRILHMSSSVPWEFLAGIILILTSLSGHHMLVSIASQTCVVVGEECDAHKFKGASCLVFTGIPVFLRFFSSVGFPIRKKKEDFNKSTLLSRFYHLCLQVPWKSIWNLYYFTRVVEIYALACRGRCIHDTFQWFCLFTNLISDFAFGKICQKISGIFLKNHLHPCKLGISLGTEVQRMVLQGPKNRHQINQNLWGLPKTWRRQYAYHLNERWVECRRIDHFS